jgi:DNA/RNA-binding domain of Phe-tRNA-synthetase-like protein
MRFSIAPEVFERFPDAFIGVVAAADVPNDAPAAGAAAELRAATAEARERLAGVDLSTHPFIARWRAAFKSVGLSPSKYRSSVEALLTRVLKGNDVPTLSPAVNLANAVSLRYMLPVGAHDADRLAGDLAVRLARAGEPFTPIGGSERDDAEEGEIVYADAAEVRTRRWVWRQGDKAKVTAATRTIFFPIDGWLELSEAETREAVSWPGCCRRTWGRGRP